jgi:hypothetical protein
LDLAIRSGFLEVAERLIEIKIENQVAHSGQSLI